MIKDILSVFGSAFSSEPEKNFKVRFGQDPFERSFRDQEEARRAFRDQNQGREPVETPQVQHFGRIWS